MRGTKPLKRLGQHFLQDRNYLRKITELARLSATDLCLEIGPGTGNLTKYLAEKAGRVVAVEIDRNLAGRLERDLPAAEIIERDFLELDLDELSRRYGAERKWKMVSNLPFNITSPVLFRLIEKKTMFSAIYLLVQSEVAARIVSGPGTKNYGILSVLCQMEADCRIVLRVPRTVFYPRPKVDSALVEIIPLEKTRFHAGRIDCFRAVVRSMFEHRRKTCYNSLRLGFKSGGCRGFLPRGKDADYFAGQALKNAEVDGRMRPEAVSIEQFARVSAWISAET
ncbi:MAG: 16S rRNA (adenine(1518)-N(6)/adenine(1519)-N(6))-dimethyltransferase RsmA [bacterium]